MRPCSGNGTYNNVLDLPFPAAAKGGYDQRFSRQLDNGLLPGLTVGVWARQTDNSPMIDVSGLSGAAPLWSETRKAVYADPALRETLQTNGVQPPDDFVPPPGVERQTICTIELVTPVGSANALTDSEWKLVDTDVPRRRRPKSAKRARCLGIGRSVSGTCAGVAAAATVAWS